MHNFFSGEVKKWLRGIQVGSIHDFQEFEAIFLRKWKHKRNSLQLLTQYNNLKRGVNEYVQDLFARVMRTYESIPTDVKPPLGATKLHYEDVFYNDFTLSFRERRSATLADMMEDAIEVEFNFLASNKTKQKGENRRVKEEAQASTSQSSADIKMDFMMKAMERIIDRLSVDDRGQTTNKECNEPQIRNPNFKQPRQLAPLPPQILQRR